jgi:hypothetical protein
MAASWKKQKPTTDLHGSHGSENQAKATADGSDFITARFAFGCALAFGRVEADFLFVYPPLKRWA